MAGILFSNNISINQDGWTYADLLQFEERGDLSPCGTPHEKNL